EKSEGLFQYYNLKKEIEEQTPDLLEWINVNYEELVEKGFVISQSDESERYLVGKTTLEMSFEEQNDWFDVKAFVQFGQFKVPFIELREYILNEIKEYPLPNGQ